MHHRHYSKQIFLIIISNWIITILVQFHTSLLPSKYTPTAILLCAISSICHFKPLTKSSIRFRMNMMGIYLITSRWKQMSNYLELPLSAALNTCNWSGSEFNILMSCRSTSMFLTKGFTVGWSVLRGLLEMYCFVKSLT